MTVLATTRNPDRFGLLKSVGVDHVIIDPGKIASAVREIVPTGVDGAVELVGTNVVKDTLRSVRTGGTVCFTGCCPTNGPSPTSIPWPGCPNGVRLTAYSGEASDLSPQELQAFIGAVAEGRAKAPIGKIYDLSDIAQGHRDMEASVGGGKLVVRVR
jgi:NADPH2:quinone reductase